MKAKWADQPTVGQYAQGHRFQKTNTAGDTVTTLMLPLASAVGTDSESIKFYRITPFQNLGIGESRVGHMGMYGISTLKIGTGASATTQGFVILILRIAKGQVVHGALGCRHDPKGAIERIYDVLRCFDIAGNHGSGRYRIQQGLCRDEDGKRSETPAIQGNIAPASVLKT